MDLPDPTTAPSCRAVPVRPELLRVLLSNILINNVIIAMLKCSLGPKSGKACCMGERQLTPDARDHRLFENRKLELEKSRA